MLIGYACALHQRSGARPPKRSAGFDNLDAKLARMGYTPKALAERFDVQPWKIRRFRSGRLDLERTAGLGAALGDACVPACGNFIRSECEQNAMIASTSQLM